MTGVFPSTEDDEGVKGGGRKREAGREGGGREGRGRGDSNKGEKGSKVYAWTS